MELQTYTGRITRQFYSNDGFSIGVVRLDEVCPDYGSTIKYVGQVAANVDEQVELRGAWEESSRGFGKQFRAVAARVIIAESPEGIAEYLADAKQFKGVGIVKARKIVEAATRLAGDGEFATGVAEHAQQVALDTKVPVETIEAIAETWAANATSLTAIAELIDYGWTPNQAGKIVERFRGNAVSMNRRNPYEFVGEVQRFGFLTVDKVALAAGFPSDSPLRVKAGIAHCFDRVGNDGHTWSERTSMIHQIIRELRPDSLDAEDMVEGVLDEMIEEGRVAQYQYGEELIVADAWLAADEVESFEILRAGFAEEVESLWATGWRKPEPSRMLDRIATLNEGQRESFERFSRYRFSVCSGAAGMGKTYLIGAMADLGEACGLRVGLGAPTGKAARRLSNATGRRATTIHKLLDFGFKPGEGFFPRFNRSNPMPFDLVIIDELSMVSVKLMRQLLDALSPTCRLAMAGDHNQIPSVSAGAVLRDILDLKVDASSVLREVVRQAGTLARNTNSVLSGVVVPELKDDIAWTIRHTSKGDEIGTANMVAKIVHSATHREEAHPIFGDHLDELWDVQVLSPTKKGPIGTFALNHMLQVARQRELGNIEAGEIEHEENRPNKPLPGDKVMWVNTNDRELEIDNGTQAIVLSREKKNGSLVLQLEDGREVTVPGDKARNVELAYAITIHKSQGSEWKYVVLVASYAHSIMHDRNLLYTGCGRASRALTIVGDSPGMRNFASTLKSKARRTFGQLIAQGWTPQPVGVPVD